MVDGNYLLDFTLEVTDYDLPKYANKETNTRLCFAIKERDSEDWDIAYFSLVPWDTNEWSLKDGMETDTNNACGQAFGKYDLERDDNDWRLHGNIPAYNPETKTLNARFTRFMLGSSMNDLAFRVGQTYQYKLILGNYINIDSVEIYDDKVDPKDRTYSGAPSHKDDDVTNLLTILKPSYDGPSKLFAEK